MTRAARRIRGFTLIEMMVAVAVTIVLLLIAVPSFQAFRQRAALRSSAEQVLGIWNQTRLESAKRNTWVKFSRTTSGGDYCVGSRVATSTSDTTGCDCFETDTTDADYCNVNRWPASGSDADQAEWRGVTIATDSTAVSTLDTVLVEPKHAFLTTSTSSAIVFVGPPGPNSYRLYMIVDGLGRGVLCEPNTAVHKMSDFGQRTCAP